MKSGLESSALFSSSKLSAFLRFDVGTGRVILDGENYLFNIPEDHGISPYSWHKLCWKSDGEIQEAIVDGKLWHNDTVNQKLYENLTVHQFFMGSGYYVDGFSINFKGELSELNIWSEAIISEQ